MHWYGEIDGAFEEGQFPRKPLECSSSISSNSWYQNSCHSPSSSKTSRATWLGFPHLSAIVPLRPRRLAFLWSSLTRTLFPTQASSDFMGVVRLLLPSSGPEASALD